MRAGLPTDARRRARDQRGFTLIELLVVVMIIGMLAAIALPVLVGQRVKAYDAKAKAAARNAITQVEACYVDNQTFDGCESDSAVLAHGDGLPSFTVTIIDPQESYRVDAQSKSGNVFTIVHTNPDGASRSCTTAGTGGCPANGSW